MKNHMGEPLILFFKLTTVSIGTQVCGCYLYLRTIFLDCQLGSAAYRRF